MRLREEQCKKVCRILDDVLANRPTERDSLIVAVRKAFKALEEPHWIPVTERLPEEGEDVLCCTLAGVMFVASYEKLHRWTDEKGWISTPSLERLHTSFVNWWTPLPKAPAEVTE